MALRIDLLPHVDAGDRTRWTGDQDERPLSDLGRRQAAALVEALAAAPVDALYSSPALRCRQTLAPLAERLGLRVAVLTELRESDGWAPPPGWAGSFYQPAAGPLGGAFAAGRMHAALRRIAAAHPDGRVVACAHGDVIPAAVAFLAGAYALPSPPVLDRRGCWYAVTFAGDGVAIAVHGPPPGFPV
jgi:8-oxo-dGTP diphosphatase